MTKIIGYLLMALSPTLVNIYVFAFWFSNDQLTWMQLMKTVWPHYLIMAGLMVVGYFMHTLDYLEENI